MEENEAIRALREAREDLKIRARHNEEKALACEEEASNARARAACLKGKAREVNLALERLESLVTVERE